MYVFVRGVRAVARAGIFSPRRGERRAVGSVGALALVLSALTGSCGGKERRFIVGNAKSAPAGDVRAASVDGGMEPFDGAVVAEFGAPAARDDCPAPTDSAGVAWQLTNPAKSREIEAYASATSINHGEPIDLYVSTTAGAYTVDVYRMGWYGGVGAAHVLGPLHEVGKHQPDPMLDANGKADCAWTNPITIQTTASWQTGVYLAKFATLPDNKQRYAIFVVRDDSSHAPLMFQTSVTTYQAYNEWGGRSLYTQPAAAVKVSFNRPYDDGRYGDGGGAGHFLYWEYPMLRWLEREGYDVAYSTDIDTHESGKALLQHQAFLSVGHDEYWTRQQRANVEAARDAGVHLGFFSANTCYWQIRLEADARGNPDRTIVCYKLNAPTKDPAAQSPNTEQDLTTEFRLPHGKLAGVGEEALVGVEYFYGKLQGDTAAWRVQDAKSWVFVGTGAKTGDTLPKMLGYEVDSVASERGDAGPSAAIALKDLHIFHSTGDLDLLGHSPYVYANGTTEYSDSTIYTADSGAIVFATGTVQWSWGLSSCGTAYPTRPAPTLTAQRITKNVLDKMLSQQTKRHK